MDGTARLPGVSPGVGVQVEDRPRGTASAAVLTGHAAFEDLAEAWDDLWSRSPSATPFQAHAWVSAWAGAYVAAGDLVVVTVRDGDVLVAGAALHRVRRGCVRLLAPLGGEISDHTDVLVDPAVPDAGLRLVEALLTVPGWHVVDLPEVLPGAAAEQWVEHWPGAVRRAA
ncbi:MAG TPA: hypothetical protein VFG13_08300, partial [Blastococcus sp.]|nr:hypothetical protein [Blastococcus sp.]